MINVAQSSTTQCRLVERRLKTRCCFGEKSARTIFGKLPPVVFQIAVFFFSFSVLYLGIDQWAVGGGAADLVNASLRLSFALWQLLAAFRLGFAFAFTLLLYSLFFGHFDALPGGAGLN